MSHPHERQPECPPPYAVSDAVGGVTGPLPRKRAKPSGASNLVQPGSGSGSGVEVGNGADGMDTKKPMEVDELGVGNGGMVVTNASGVGAVPAIGSLAQQPLGAAPAAGAPGAPVQRVAPAEMTPPQQQQATVGVSGLLPRHPTDQRGVNRPQTRAQHAQQAAAQQADDLFIPPSPSRWVSAVG